MSTKQRGVDLAYQVLKMRPDIKTLEVMQVLDSNALESLFLQRDLGGNIEELVFKKFMWYD